MKVFFDTSVLVAAFVETHPQNSDCLPWLDRVQTLEIQGVISAHTLAELFSVLTRLPRQLRIPPQLAQELMQINLQHFEKVPLQIEDYDWAIERMVCLKLSGGAIFDALIAAVVLKVEVDRLLTLNPKHFSRLGVEIASIVQIP